MYWSYVGYDTDSPVIGNRVYTLSESQILDYYWDYWYERMCAKFGKDHVDENYTKNDCIDDWIAIHWAWESTKEGERTAKL